MVCFRRIPSYAILSRAFDRTIAAADPPSYRGITLGGIGTGAIQSLPLSPVELVKIRLQLQNKTSIRINQSFCHNGPIDVARIIVRAQGLRGIYCGLGINVLSDAPAHGVYFLTYEYVRANLHPGCRKNGQESFRTMLLAGGLAGVASWICCNPLDVIKTRLQAQSHSSVLKYSRIVDCFGRSVREDTIECFLGYNFLEPQQE